MRPIVLGVVFVFVALFTTPTYAEVDCAAISAKINTESSDINKAYGVFNSKLVLGIQNMEREGGRLIAISRQADQSVFYLIKEDYLNKIRPGLVRIISSLDSAILFSEEKQKEYASLKRSATVCGIKSRGDKLSQKLALLISKVKSQREKVESLRGRLDSLFLN